MLQNPHDLEKFRRATLALIQCRSPGLPAAR